MMSNLLEKNERADCQGADPGAAGRRVLSLLWLRRERLDVSLLFLSCLPNAAGAALEVLLFLAS